MLFRFNLILFFFTIHVFMQAMPWMNMSRKYFAASQSPGFGAISDGKKVIVNWTTPNEQNFDYFTVERSKDGVNFVTAVMIKGAGKVSAVVDYTDIDYSPFSGISYYRLKQTDYFGDFSYSEIVAVNFQISKNGSVIPNNNKLPDETELKELENKMVLVVLKDKQGKEFISKVEIAADTEHLLVKNSRNSLSPGIYTVIASSYNPLQNQKLTVR
jgi:hypothetical protein